MSIGAADGVVTADHRQGLIRLLLRKDIGNGVLECRLQQLQLRVIFARALVLEYKSAHIVIDIVLVNIDDDDLVFVTCREELG